MKKIPKKKNSIGERPKNKVWEQFNADQMAIFLLPVSGVIQNGHEEYLQKLGTENPEKAKKRKITDQPSIKSFHDSIEELPEGRVSRINRALAKAFICAGLPFHTIENPFFVDFLKELNPAYHPPSRDLLSNRLIEEELAKVNYKLEQELHHATNLTLGKKIMFIIIIY
jgi:hypothetical protein